MSQYRHFKIRGLPTLCVAALVSGCASSGSDTLSRTLQAVGVQSPPSPEQLKALEQLPIHRAVALRLHAGAVLNTDSNGQSLALVVRVYRLKSPDAFLQTPYELFQLDTTQKPLPFSGDVIDAREIVLAPGKQAETLEKLGMDVNAIGVVALFRTPQNQRWKFAFDAKTAASTGITVGLHGCAMSVSQGQPLGTVPEQLRVAGVRCTA